MTSLKTIWAVVIIAAVCFLLGVLTVLGLPTFLFGLTSNAYLRFVDSCLLFAILLSLVRLSAKKSE